MRPRNQDIAVLLNAFDFRRSPGYGSGTTSLGSSSSGHSHASHFSAPRHRSGARAQGTVVFSTPRHRGGAREVRVPGAVMRPFSRAKSEARAATCLWGATYLSRERYASLRHNLGGGHISGVRISGEPHISREPHIWGGAHISGSRISQQITEGGTCLWGAAYLRGAACPGGGVTYLGEAHVSGVAHREAHISGKPPLYLGGTHLGSRISPGVVLASSLRSLPTFGPNGPTRWRE